MDPHPLRTAVYALRGELAPTVTGLDDRTDQDLSHLKHVPLAHCGGYPLVAHDLAWLRRSIGVVSQDPTMFAGTVAENIAYARPHASRAEVEAAAAAANAHG